MEVSSFLARKTVGVVLRTFAAKEEDVPKRVAAIRQMVDLVRGVRIGDASLIRNIDVVVFADTRFGARADCGKTAAGLRDELQGDKKVFVSEVRHGDLFCGVLNYAVARQLRSGMDYTAILSTEVGSYVNTDTFMALVEALCAGAKATGVALNELAPSILEGRLANTFCVWENDALVQVGGFDLRAAMPVDDKLAHYMRGWSSEKKDHVYYALAGVEEVIPLARLVETFGPCIAPVLPRGEGIKAYEVPDPVTQPDLWKRHISKMGTKYQRQVALLAAIGCDADYLNGGVMPVYRTF